MILVVAGMCCLLFPGKAQVSFGEPEKLNDEWKFILKDIPEGAAVDLNDKRWEDVSLPHDWSVGQPLSPSLASGTGYLPGGTGWYRKRLLVPADHAGKMVYLYFEGVYNRSEVYINGVLLGKRPNGYISFLYDATSHVEFGKENVIAVRADHSQWADSRWYTGSGIYRDVWVVYAHPVHISQWGVYAWPELQKQDGLLHVEVSLENGLPETSTLLVKHELLDPQGHVVAKSAGELTLEGHQTGKINAALHVSGPERWSLEDPVLYRLKTLVFCNGQLTDETVTTTGFREFSFDPDKGFALNGEWMKVKGVCLHHDAGVLGSAVPREVWERRLLNLKEIGVNAIRTSHNPQAPVLYELCDSLGLLVLNEAFDEWEFPKRKWIEGWNVGTPGFQGSYDFFNTWGEKDLGDMVKRDRNHLSIFAWSIGNEVDYPNDPYSHPVLDGGGETGFTQPVFGGYKKDAPDAMRLGDIARRMVSVVKTYDRTRPVTAGLAGVLMSNQTEYPFVLDMTGYNYTEKLYDIDHARYPDRIIFGSENRHNPEAWQAVTSRDFIFGQFLWTGIDYLGEAGRWPSRGSSAGLLDLGGFIKPRGYFRQSLWSGKPMAYLGTYPAPEAGRGDQKKTSLSMDALPVWNYEEGRMIRVVCYTNAVSAGLLLNGQPAGEQKAYDEQTGIIYWDIPFAPGKLEVVGLDAGGREISRFAIRSSGRSHALRVFPGETQMQPGGIAQVIVQVMDDQGIPVMLSDDEITCELNGDAQLLGLEAGNKKDMSDYTDNKHRVYRGRLIAYIKAGETKGAVTAKFSAPWLESAEFHMSVQ